MSPRPRSIASQSKAESDPNKLLKLTRDALQAAPARGSEYLWPKRGPCLALRATSSGLQRGLAILQHLLDAVTRAGHTVSVTADGTFLHVAGESLSLELREMRRQVSHVPTPEELNRRKRYPDTETFEPRSDLEPTGKFTVLIEERGYLPTKVGWKESERRTVEERIPEVILALPTIAAAKRARREEGQRREAEYKARQQLALEAEQRRVQEQQALDRLLRQVGDWSRARQIREFVEAARQAAEQQAPAGVPADTFTVWEARSLAIAARLDPLENPPVGEILG